MTGYDTMQKKDNTTFLFHSNNLFHCIFQTYIKFRNKSLQHDIITTSQAETGPPPIPAWGIATCLANVHLPRKQPR